MVSGNHEGWSESSPLPGHNYSYEYGRGAYEVAKQFLVPVVVGKEFASARELNDAMLAKMLDTPLCLDEGVTEPWQAEQAAELGACRYINIKPACVGGLQNAIDINNICSQAGIGCWIRGMLESDVGKAICAELAALPNMVYPHNISPSVYSYPEIITSSLRDQSSLCTIRRSDKIGTPVVPDMEKFLKMVIANMVITANGELEA